MSAHASIRDLISVVEPHLDVVSVSDPEPVLRAYNAVGVFPSRDGARNAVLAVENLDPRDTAVGMVVLGSFAQSEAVAASSTDASGNPRGADREGVVSDIVPRAVKGAVIFGVVGAVLAGVMIALFGDPELVVAGVLAAAVFGAAVGAIWGAFIRMGLSDTYRESFVELDSFDEIIVTYHTDDHAEAQEAARRFALAGDRNAAVLELDEIIGPTFEP